MAINVISVVPYGILYQLLLILVFAFLGWQGKRQAIDNGEAIVRYNFRFNQLSSYVVYINKLHIVPSSEVHLSKSCSYIISCQ